MTMSGTGDQNVRAAQSADLLEPWRAVSAAVAVMLAAAALPVVVGNADVVDVSLRLTRATAMLAACGAVGSAVLRLLAGTSTTSPSSTACTRWALVWLAATASTVALNVLVIGGNVRGLVLTGWGAALLAVVAGKARSRRDDWVVLALALAALTPMAFIAHSVHADTSALAVASMVVHVFALTTWFGCLLALAVRGPGLARHDAELLRRFSPLALVCFVAVVESGVVNVLARMSAPRLLDAGPYALLLAVKLVLLVLLGWIGLQHRRRTLPKLAAGRPSAFWSLVVGELVVLAVVAGLGVALAGTPAPIPPADPLTPDLHAQSLFAPR